MKKFISFLMLTMWAFCINAQVYNPSVSGLGEQSIFTNIKKPQAGTTLINVTPEMWAYKTFSKPQAAFTQLNAFAEISVKTAATSIDVLCASTQAGQSFATIGVFVNGVFSQTISPASSTPAVITISLPAGSKTVMFRMGETVQGSGSTVLGQYLGRLSVAPGNSLSVITPNSGSNRTVFIGNSITVGQGTSVPERFAFINLMRSDQRFSIYSTASYGWATNSIAQCMGSTTLSNGIVSDLIAYYNGAQTKECIIELGTNDYGLNKASPIVTANNLAYFVDQLHLSDASINIKIQTALFRSTETANTLGFTLQNYRDQFTLLASTRPWLSIIDGTQIVTLTDLNDGLHPNIYGNAKVAEYYIRYKLGIPQAQPLSFSDQYLLTNGTATGNISIPNSTTLNLVPLNNVTVTFYAKRVRVGGSFADYVFSQGAGAGGIAIGFLADQFRVLITGSGSSVALSKSSINIDTMVHHWAVVQSGLTYSVYQDSYFVGSSTLTAKQSNASAISYIGTYFTTGSANQPSNIKADRVRIYNISLNQAQIIADMNTSILSNYTNVLAAYDLNGNANDVSNNGHNGTVGATAVFLTP